ncbi:MAG: hypothetical protein A2096_03810 [Spirochaetes bacterium GWF1_41_5]|nr:MAG: hypothetical protein A2096_03810 [Spirochaetes bacterium GWF1_41_5]HBE02599.1 hypothetical protein [Spirochaetia bacterium]
MLETYRITDQEFSVIRRLVYDQAGIALNDSKKQLVVSRLARRLRTLGFADFTQYIEYLQDHRNSDEWEQMINRISTNKTDFFRENHHFEFLRATVLPACRNGINIWSAASSSGEEPYSIAITVLDFLEQKKIQRPFSITASDVSTAVLAKARSGVYPEESISALPEETVKKYFLKGTGTNEGRVKVKPVLADAVHFEQINLMEPLSFTGQFDVVFLRNVIIYFDKDTKTELVKKIYNVIRPGGYLFLGHSESMFGLAEYYQFLGKTIYRKK